MTHFCMADPAFTNLSGFLLNQIGKWGAQVGYKYLNFQEDMGEEGLRRFKTERAPSSLLRKFSIRQVVYSKDLNSPKVEVVNEPA